jgi:hypothetical protein
MSEVTTDSGHSPRPWLAVVVLAVLLVAVVAYSFHERALAKRAAVQNSAIATSLSATQGQVQALTSKLDAITAKEAEKPAPSHPTTSLRRPAISNRLRSDDPRWKQVQSRLDDQGKQIDSTRQDLVNTRTELQGSIARTHDELVVLQKKGERSYYEFDLDKSGQFQREGPVGVRLRKANTKHEYADLELMVDDFKLSKKHVNVFEPVAFYSSDNGRPVELVINSIAKNHIHGYVSEPKYKNSDLDAMAGSGISNASQRQQLPAPSEANKN